VRQAAQTWHLTGEACFAEGCRTLLSSWFDQCPYPLGPNWTSSLEHGVRLLNWAVAWFLLGDRVEAELRRRWLEAIYRHCHFIAGHFSRHSSVNNHLLGELMGLFVATPARTIGWPMWPARRAGFGWRRGWCGEDGRRSRQVGGTADSGGVIARGRSRRGTPVIFQDPGSPRPCGPRDDGILRIATTHAASR
jgi:hypothetical protein